MRWPLACFAGMTLVTLLSGCRSSRGELVERELYAKDTDLRTLREEMGRCHSYNQALQQEIRNLRGEHVPQGELAPPVAIYPIRSLTLGRQTGGADTNGCAGDAALQVVLEPRDCDGQAIKAPGSASVQVIEVNPEGLKRPLSTWEISPDQLRRSWKSGLLSTGYTVQLPWKVWPSQAKLRVVAQFRLADGRVFEADKDVTVKLTPANQRRMPGADDVPPNSEQLPPPRPVDPGAGPTLDSRGPKPAPPGPSHSVSGWGNPLKPLPVISPAVELGRPIAPTLISVPVLLPQGPW
jgi:hypothetical protein